jgi:HK97 gp10 family phage protein
MSKQLVEITGFRELQSKIKKLGNDGLKRREMLKLLRQSSKATVKAARAQAPMSKKQHIISGSRTRKIINPGQLKKSVGNITGKAKNKAVIYVGPRTKGKKWDGFYGAFVHGGTKTQSANPFMDRAYRQTKGQVTQETEKSVTRYVQKQINKLSNA